MRRTCFVLGSAALAVGLALTVAAAGQGGDSPRRVTDGVFTAEQAVRGKVEYDLSCARCHNIALLGSERGPAIKGDAFISRWEKDNLAGLFIKIRDTMPEGGAGTVNDQAKIDILSFILQENGFPAGSSELTLDADILESIRIGGEDAEAGPPNFSFVRVMGCLAHDPDGRWILTNATEPAPSRDEAPLPGALVRAAAEPLGTQIFELVSVPRSLGPDHLGKKVEVRGLLYRVPGDAALNITSLDIIASSCPE